MVKAFIKNQNNVQQRITVYFGYGLFLLTAVSLIVSLLPLGGTSTYPEDLHWNVIATMVAFALATILPVVAGYIAGDVATRSDMKLTHHYNGVLFAILGYWVTVIVSSSMVFINFSDITYSIPSYVVSSLVPVLVAILTVVILGICYARHTKHQRSLLNYLPYKALLLTAVGSLFILSGVSIASGAGYGADLQSSIAVLLLPVVMIAVLVAFGAWVIGSANGTLGQRLLKSIITLSYSFIAMTF